MSLQKTTIPILLTDGLDQKTDEKLVLPSKLLELENGVFTKAGRINKRNGYDVLDTRIEDGGTISNGEALGVFNDELNLYSGTNLYSYSEATTSWKNKGYLTATIIESTPVVRNSYSQTNPTTDYLSGLTCTAWEDSRGGARYTITNVDGTILVNDGLIDALATNVFVVTFQNNFFIFYTLAADTSLNYKLVSFGTPLTLGAKVTVTTNMNAVPNFDCIAIGSKIFVAYFNVANQILIRTIDNLFVISSATTLANSALNCLGLWTDDSQNLWLGFSNNVNVSVAAYNYNMVAILATTTIEAIANANKITGFTTGTTAKVFYQITAAATYNHYVKTNTITLAAVVGTATDFLRSVGLASKAFKYSSLGYVNLVHESTLQATYFTVSESNNVVAKINPQIGGTLISGNNLTTVPTLDSTTFLFPNQIKTQLVSDTGTIYSLTGITGSTINFSSENKFQNVQLGQLLIGGGVVASYDGALITEHGFHFFPEDISSVTTTTTGFISPGTYQYVVCYEWTDNMGAIHRSAPSLPVTQVVPAGTTTNKNTLTIPTLRITQKQNVRLVVYRTEADGTQFYQVSSVASPTFNSTTADSVSFADTLADASILGNTILYTTGGVLENIAPPAASFIVTYKNRIFLAGLEDNLDFWYSKVRQKNAAVEFSDFLVGRVNADGGPITGLGVMDNYVIFFKGSSIYAMSGEGPTALGTQNDFQEPILVTSDTGCSNPNSICSTPDGLTFKSPKGIYLLSRSLQVSYIGAPVEDNNDKLLTACSLLSKKNQIRFVTNDDTALIYDYYFDQWGTFTNHTAEDTAIWQDKFVFLRPNGEVWVEATHFKDNNLFIPMKITTAWIATAGVKGFQRIYRMAFLGEYKSKHKMDVSIGYDYNPYFQQVGQVNVDERYVITTYGEDSPYGAGTPYGGEFPLYQFKTHMTRQKCEAVRFSFTDNQYYLSDFAEGFNLCTIALECGIKGTMAKMPASNSFSTTAA